MDMDDREFVRIVDEIISGRKIITNNGSIYIFIQPYKLDRELANAFYEIKLEEAIKSGVIPEDELMKRLEEKGIWTEDDEADIDRLLERIVSNRKIRNKLQLPSRKKKVDETIEELTKEYYGKINEKYRSYNLCAEGVSSSYRDYYLMSKCILDSDENKVWGSVDEVMGDGDSDNVLILKELFLKFLQSYEVGTIRKIARSGYFRGFWSINKNIGGLFRLHMHDWSASQIELSRWSGIYDSVYKDLHRPPDSVVEDDAALDEWLEERHNKYQADVLERSGKYRLPVSGDVILVGADSQDLRILRGGEDNKKKLPKGRNDIKE